MILFTRRTTASRTASFALFSGIAIALWLFPGRAEAQQSLFNVPSAKVTKPGELFFQEQINFSKQGESNLTTDVGLGKGLELGLNVMHVQLYPANTTLSPNDPSNDAFSANAQWILPATPWLNVAFGTQDGISARDGKPGVHYVGWGWSGLRFEPAGGRFGGYVLGGYYGTKSWTGQGPQAGGMIGFEIPLVGEYVSACADWMIGANRASVAVVGLQVTPVPKWGWQVSLGGQLPGLAPDAGYAFVFELTHLGLGAYKEEPKKRGEERAKTARLER